MVAVRERGSRTLPAQGKPRVDAEDVVTGAVQPAAADQRHGAGQMCEAARHFQERFVQGEGLGMHPRHSSEPGQAGVEPGRVHDSVPFSGPERRKFSISANPCWVRKLSGWNCTPNSGWRTCWTPMGTPSAEWALILRLSLVPVMTS